MFPNTPTPPQPIHTRWGTWIEAAIYFALHFEEISTFLDGLDPEDALSIDLAQTVLKKPNIKRDLAFIKSNFECLSTTIVEIQARGALLTDSIRIFESVRPKLQALSKRKEFITKFKQISDKNTGLTLLRKISQLLNGEELSEPDEYIDNLTPNELAAFKYAPTVSCDVERTFSAYKRVLEDCRRSFIFENLRMHVIIHCNKFD